jgi:hypothetical protein
MIAFLMDAHLKARNKGKQVTVLYSLRYIVC